MNILKNPSITLKDFWLYICLHKYNDKSLRELSEISRYSIPIIRESIKVLQKENYIDIIKDKRKQRYILKDKLIFKFKQLSDVKASAFLVALQLFYE